MKVVLEGIELNLAHPDELNVTWVGQEEAMRQLMAAWMVIDDRDFPMNPRLLGKPGVGKTTMAYAAGRRLGREVYIFQATVDTRPEDLLITPVIEGTSKLKYVASPLVTAMIRGGVGILARSGEIRARSAGKAGGETRWGLTAAVTVAASLIARRFPGLSQPRRIYGWARHADAAERRLKSIIPPRVAMARARSATRSRPSTAAPRPPGRRSLAIPFGSRSSPGGHRRRCRRHSSR